jgi:type I restriction enzyme S subunit
MMSVKYVPLKKLITVIRNGLNIAQYDQPVDEGMLPISRIETISDGTIDFTRVKYSEVSETERIRYQLHSGDILFSHINSPEHIGKTAIFNSDKPLIHGVNLLLLRPNLESCYPEYLNYYLKSFEVRAWFRARCKKAVNQASLNQGDIQSLVVPLPLLDEQKRIAAILSKADRLRRLRRYVRELSDGYLGSVFLEMFGDPVSNPMGWPTALLGKVAVVQRGRFSPRPRNDPRYYGGEYPFIQTGDIARSNGFLKHYTQTLNEIGTRVSRAFDLGTVVIAIVGATIGETAILAIRAYCPDSVIGIRVAPNAGTSEYIEYMLRFWKPIFKAMAPETARANINLETLRPLAIPLPPLSLQQKFAQIVHRFERLRAQHREAERQAEHLLQSLLHRAFQGEI